MREKKTHEQMDRDNNIGILRKKGIREEIEVTKG